MKAIADIKNVALTKDIIREKIYPSRNVCVGRQKGRVQQLLKQHYSLFFVPSQLILEMYV